MFVGTFSRRPSNRRAQGSIEPEIDGDVSALVEPLRLNAIERLQAKAPAAGQN
jgi:hypothetical protein